MVSLNRIYDQYNFRTAAQHGSFNCIKYLYALNCNWENDIIYYGVLGDNLELLKWLFDNNFPIPRGEYLEYISIMAANNNNLPILKLLKDQNIPFNWETFDEAAKHKSITTIEWLYHNKCPFENSCHITAANYGNLNIIQWLLSKDILFDDILDIITTATENNHLNILEWSMNSSFINTSILQDYINLIFETAIDNNHLNILIWLVENNYPLDQNKCINIANNLLPNRYNREIINWLISYLTIINV